MEFFRHCPQCGCRFHIKLESKKLVGVDKEALTRPTSLADVRASRIGLSPGALHLIVQADTPNIIDIEDLQYVYKCGHCGHEWT